MGVGAIGPRINIRCLPDVSSSLMTHLDMTNIYRGAQDFVRTVTNDQVHRSFTTTHREAYV